MRSLGEQLTQQIKEQNLTPEEVMKMNSEKEALARTYEELMNRKAEVDGLILQRYISLVVFVL